MVGNNAWVRYVTRLIERDFPNLSACGYRLTSQDSPDYNCVAWAADDDQRWWWPDADGIHYWPPNVPRELALEAYRHTKHLVTKSVRMILWKKNIKK